MKGICVIKCSNQDAIHLRAFLKDIAKAINGEAILLPIDSTVTFGQLAKDELVKFRDDINGVLERLDG